MVIGTCVLIYRTLPTTVPYYHDFCTQDLEDVIAFIQHFQNGFKQQMKTEALLFDNLKLVLRKEKQFLLLCSEQNMYSGCNATGDCHVVN